MIPARRFLAAAGLALGTLVATAAHATEDEASLQVGLVTMDADAMETFSYDGVMPSYGVRGGWAFHDRLSLMGGLATGQRGMVTSNSVEGGTLFRAAYTATTLMAGLKADVEPSPYVAPYVLGGLVAHMGVVRLDDDPTRRDHPGQVRSLGGSGGAMAAAGVQFRFGKPDAEVRPALSLELGWQGVLQHRYATSGDRMLPLGYNGVAFSSGFGAVF